MLDDFSFTSVPLFMYFKNKVSGQDTYLSHGTAFFYQQNDKFYLVTNWHNLSGRNHETKEYVSRKNQVEPDSIGIQFHINGEKGTCTTEDFRYQLYDSQGTALWRQHKIYANQVDIGILEIKIPDNNFKLYPINIIPDDDIPISVARNVFILGFPQKLFTKICPIWKKATIASEYNIPIDNLPKFLVDTDTFSGMSGSPVILREYGSLLTTSGNYYSGNKPSYTRFLGIYSGRYPAEDKDKKVDQYGGDVKLGIVWKKCLIDEIIQEGVPGENHFKKENLQ